MAATAGTSRGSSASAKKIYLKKDEPPIKVNSLQDVLYVTTVGSFLRAKATRYERSIFDYNPIAAWQKDEQKRKEALFHFKLRHIIDPMHFIVTEVDGTLPNSNLALIKDRKLEKFKNKSEEDYINILCQFDMGCAWIRRVGPRVENVVYQTQILKQLNTLILAPEAVVINDLRSKAEVLDLPLNVWSNPYPVITLKHDTVDSTTKSAWRTQQNTPLPGPGNLLNNDICLSVPHNQCGSLGQFTAKYDGFQHCLVGTTHERVPTHLSTTCKTLHQEFKLGERPRVLAGACANRIENAKRQAYRRGSQDLANFAAKYKWPLQSQQQPQKKPQNRPRYFADKFQTSPQNIASHIRKTSAKKRTLYHQQQLEKDEIESRKWEQKRKEALLRVRAYLKKMKN